MDALLPAIYLVGPTLVAYALIGRSVQAKTPSEYLTGAGGMGTTSYFAIVCGSSVSLGGAILAFLGLGYALPWVAVLATATWLIGFYIHYRTVVAVIQDGADKNLTLHGLLGSKTKSDAVRIIAAFASIFGFAGAYGVEMVAITKLTAPLVGNNALHNVVVLAVLVAGLLAYMYRGGILAVASTDKLQLPLFAAAILFSVYFVVGRAQSPTFSLADNLAISNSSFPPLLCVALIFLNIPWQIVDMSQWQRSFSCRDSKTIRNGLIASAIGIAISWLLLIGLGTLLREVPLKNNDPVSTFIDLFAQNPYAYAVFLVACVAALLSTADAYVIAAVQSFYRDIALPARHDIGIKADSVLELRRLTVAFVVFPPFVAYGIGQIIPNILGLFFLVFAAQLALVPVAYMSFVRRQSVRSIRALVSILTGFGCAMGIFFYSIFSGDETYFFWSPIATILFASLAMMAFRK